MAKKENKEEQKEETFGEEIQAVVNKYMAAGVSPFELIGILQSMQFDIMSYLKDQIADTEVDGSEKKDGEY